MNCKLIKFFTKADNFRNTYYLRYHALRGFNKLMLGLGLKSKDALDKQDTFNWKLYNLHYRGEVHEALKANSVALKANDYKYSQAKLVQENPSIKPLHPVWKLLYETILELGPRSILEAGCGSGLHLNNLQVLAPDIELSGVDLSRDQIDYMRETCPDLKVGIRQVDLTKELPADLHNKADLVFTVAVTMHIHQGDSHKKALANIFNMSKQYVILVERWRNHNYLEDIKELKAKGEIGWDNINFHYREEESGRPAFLICSKTKLGYPELTNYDQVPKD
jgi:SAM-dependent methyltransferase